VFFCGRSDYFRALLDGHFSESTSPGKQLFSASVPEVHLNDVSPDVFAAVVSFVYQDDALVSTLDLTASRFQRNYVGYLHTEFFFHELGSSPVERSLRSSLINSILMPQYNKILFGPLIVYYLVLNCCAQVTTNHSKTRISSCRTASSSRIFVDKYLSSGERYQNAKKIYLFFVDT